MKQRFFLSLAALIILGFIAPTMEAGLHQRKVYSKAKSKRVLVPIKRADLVVSACQSLETNVYKLKVTVKNIGNAASKKCILRIEDLTNKSNYKKHDVTFQALGAMPRLTTPGGAKNVRTVIITCPFKVYGNTYIRTTIDATKKIGESNEKNNTCHYDTLIK